MMKKLISILLTLSMVYFTEPLVPSIFILALPPCFSSRVEVWDSTSSAFISMPSISTAPRFGRRLRRQRHPKRR